MYYIVPDTTYGGKSINEIDTIIKNSSSKYLSSKNLYLNLVSSNGDGLLYELDDSNFNLDPKNIGDIMLKFLDIIFNESKVYLAQYNASLDFFEKDPPKDFMVLQEELLFENMTLEEKKQKLNFYIQEIGTTNKDVIIIDAYLFSKKSNNEYKELLRYLLNTLGFSKLIIVTNKKDFDEAMFNEIKSELDGDVLTYFSNEYHDRFWISDYKYGFTTGTSLNGIGNKKCRIDFLKSDEVLELVNDIKKSFNLNSI